MGFVFQARELEAGKLCALKLLHKASPQDRRRFEREARVLSDLYHPGIVRYLDHGLTSDEEPGYNFQYSLVLVPDPSNPNRLTTCTAPVPGQGMGVHVDH